MSKAPLSLEIILADKAMRMAYCRYDFLTFWSYYFSGDFVAPIAPFHREWARSLSQSSDDILFIGFRWSLKTSIVIAYLVWCAVYSLEEYIVVQSYEQTNSTNLTTTIAQSILSAAIIADFWALFPLVRKRDDLTKKSVANFTTTTGVRFEARSLGSTLRGPVSRSGGSGRIERPTLLVLDDIDVEASVRNSETIAKNEHKIITETIGSMSLNRRRILFLGNIIREDGVVPRFERAWKERKGTKIFRQALLDDSGRSNWSDYFTPEKVESLKSASSLSFAQNYQLIPYIDGQKLIKDSDIRAVTERPKGGRVCVGIDPAFSERRRSDAIGVTVTVSERLPKRDEEISHQFLRCVLESTPYEGKEKNELAFVRSMMNLNAIYKPSLFRVEGNNGGEILVRMLKDAGLPVELVYQHKDKETRVRERQGEFERWHVSFLVGKTEKLRDQLKAFPTTGVHDDLVDSYLLSLSDDSGQNFYIL